MASLLLTRPRPQSERFRALVESDVPTVISPLFRIENLQPAIPADISGLVVTSANGAAALARMAIDRRLPVFAVGRRTADVAREAGHAATSAEGDAGDLVRLILDRRPSGPLLHIRGEVSLGNVAARLNEAGIPCREAIAYRQAPETLSTAAQQLLAARTTVVVPLFSPATGSMFAYQGPFAAPLRLVCMSGAVADAVARLPAESLTVAARPNAGAMAAATLVALGA